MAISLRQTLAQLTTHTHTYDMPRFSGEASYQSFLSFPAQYANLLVPFQDPSQPSGGPLQTGTPDFSNPSASQSGH
jgi:hypothetical protein